MNRPISVRIAYLFSVALTMLFIGFGASAQSEDAIQFEIPPLPLSDALILFGDQSGRGVMADSVATETLDSPGFSGEAEPESALQQLLQGTGLNYRQDGDVFVIVSTASSAVAGQNTVGQRRPGIEEIIVTGQKREERIQDVPIAISAFSAEDLEAQKLEGGFDLLKAIPNVSFSKTNFTSYNFQIRGVGTQSISATSDPGVAVSFNNAAIIQNRLFEQEYLDVERVEVLRGPQGTLYGRNATAGVINVISNKPELGVWDGMIDVEVGNYNTRRLRGHFNMPLGDEFAIRGAYASTDREGYTFNSGTGNSVDGRDLWTGRLSLRWQPTDRLRADLIYERFEENDDRLRTGKQLCHRDDGPEVLEVSSPALDDVVLADHVSFTFGEPGTELWEAGYALQRATFAQGCKPGSLYTDGAFDTPNGLSFNFIHGILKNATGSFIQGPSTTAIARDGEGSQLETNPVTFIQLRDPFGGRKQSRDLREIESIRDPVYRAEADLFQLNIDFDVTDALTFSSQTVYNEDETYSFQDFNRFNTDPIFTDSTEFFPLYPNQPRDFTQFSPGGVFCDPQIGCSDKMAGFDIAQASAEQFNQEFRLQSAFSGPLNFSVGANYTEFEALVDYYIMFNVLSALTMSRPFNIPDPNTAFNPAECDSSSFFRDDTPFPGGPSVPTSDPNSPCPYVDPNPLDTSENFEGDGHNYFRSKNPYELESWAAFGELYWNIQDDLKLTVGLRYTDDQKTFIPVPTQVLLSPSWITGGTVPKGYPEDPPIEQQWGEWTGRIVLDWQPILGFTDETLIYGSFSRGYKGGGANPPKPGFATAEESVAIMEAQGLPDFLIEGAQGEDGFLPILQPSEAFPDTFEPEFINAYELGTKNTLFGGAVTFNATAFYYDYTDYQVSQIRERTAINENFDAEIWGLELETIFVPSPNWQFLANIGYLDTKIAEGETSIDIMNRTQGNPDYTLTKPWVQLPSNCVVPTAVAAFHEGPGGPRNYALLCGNIGGLLGIFNANAPAVDPNFDFDPYDPANYPELNGGAGLAADLGGNELPQSPNLTATVGGQYSFDVTPEWRGTVRMDYYWQDESYHRVYNLEPYDRLKSWSNTNLSFWVNNANSGITVEAYVKNLFNQTPITGAFLNSDDTGLTTNVFMFDPRLIGVSVRKEW